MPAPAAHTAASPSRPLDVVVIGAGQAGLSTSAVLQEAGVEHLVLESEHVGASWRRRWDTFQVNTANMTMALHDHAYAGDDPEGFMTAPEVIDMLAGYAQARALPVKEGCTVQRVAPAAGGYAITTDQGRIHARSVVVATGEYRRARMPRVPFAPSATLTVLHSGQYRNAGQLADGAVLVIGGGSRARRSPRTCMPAGERSTGHWPTVHHIRAACVARTRCSGGTWPGASISM